MKKTEPPKNTENAPQIDKKKIEAFNLELSKLIKKYDIKQHACIFIIENREMLTFYPDLISTTRLLKSNYAKCRQQIMNTL